MDANVNGLRLSYDDHRGPSATCLLLVHGFPLDRRMWQGQVEDLAKIARLIVPDLRGHGVSEVTAGPSTMAQHAADLTGLLDFLGIEKAVVAGLSMGGYVAFEMWRQSPHRIAGLVLLDTRAEPDQGDAKASRDKRIRSVQEDGVAPLAEDMVDALLAPSNAGDRHLRQIAVDIMVGQPPEGMIGALQGLRDRADSRPMLPRISVPVLVLVGEEDKLTPPEVARGMAEQIPGATLVVVPRAGHLSPLENPATVNRAIAAFLEKVGRGG